jgi:hypothetical protein
VCVCVEMVYCDIIFDYSLACCQYNYARVLFVLSRLLSTGAACHIHHLLKYTCINLYLISMYVSIYVFINPISIYIFQTSLTTSLVTVTLSVFKKHSTPIDS